MKESKTSSTASVVSDNQSHRSEKEERDAGLWRDLFSYWMFGLCNNFGYVVMLTAAHDIIGSLSHDDNASKIARATDDNLEPGERPCNVLSTGAILLADIIPGLTVKTLSPFIPFWSATRISVSCIFAAGGFIVVAFAEQYSSVVMALGGVAMISAASGLGEPTFLAYSSFFNKNVISTWSSGTGGAGIIGALAYTLLRQVLKLDHRTSMLVMISVPIVEIIIFFFVLRKPSSTKIEDQQIGEDVSESEENIQPMRSLKEKLLYVKRLVPYMVPLGLVYFFEYFINQGLFELVYFPKTELVDLKAVDQYRWYQVTYQIGVFISRSSVNIIQIPQIWVMAVLQGLNAVFFTFEAIYMFTPSIWIILALIIFEGLLGGGAYVNTFYRMSKEIPATRREFSVSFVTLSDSIGITLAGFLAMPAHNALCKLPGGMRLQ